MIERLLGLGRGWLALAGIGIVAALILAFVPLFNLIGYESAAFYGVLYGLTVGYLRFDDRSVSGWARQLARNLLLLVVPFTLLTVNALRVRNCDFGAGVTFWILIPVISITLATTLGWAVRNFAGERRKLGHGLIALVSLATVVEFGLRLAVQPPIIGFHWFLGYFSGSIYDEALDVPRALVAYRVIHLFGVCATVCGVQAWRDYRAERSSTPGLAVIAVILAAITVYGFSVRANFGVDVTRERIAEELGGVAETEHFIIHYPAKPAFSRQIDRIIEDHEFRYREMKEFFGTDPVKLHGRKVRSFVYPGRDAKGKLMGARRTLVAKIWLHEMHILWRYYGDHMLAHELAHVFTEPFGNGPLRLSSRYWVFVNMGLVEGVATAADWDAESLDPHQAAAALRELDKAPDITRLVGASGFWTQSSGRAYILMGSFVRWLVETYGIEKFRVAYGRGEFARVYGVPTGELVARWEQFVDAIELTEEQLDRARYVYDRKSIFQKVCARTIADMRLRARESARAGQRDRAIEIFEAIIAFDPRNAEYRIEYARFLKGLGESDQAREVLLEVLEWDLDPARRAAALATLGDLLWIEGETDDARSRYTECLEVGLPVQSERLLRVKRIALERTPAEAEFARKYLVDDDVADAIRIFFPHEWARRHPDEPVASYLLGRRLLAEREWTWAEPHLRRALDVPEGVLRDEAVMMLVKALHFQDRPEEARALLRTWEATDRYYELLRDEWLRRVDWKVRNTLGAGGR